MSGSSYLASKGPQGLPDVASMLPHPLIERTTTPWVQGHACDGQRMPTVLPALTASSKLPTI